MKLSRNDDTTAPVAEALTLVELSTFCHVGPDWVVTLVSHGVLEPAGKAADDWRFDPQNVARARKALRLAHDFDLNTAGLALVLDLIEERDALVRRLSLVERT